MHFTLPIVECFHSIQGEGAHVGRSAYFIRLAGCRVGCPWCDTKNSWDATIHNQVNINKIANDAINASLNKADFIVITGGEPLHHNLDPLCNEIRRISITKTKTILIHLETSGVDPISGNPNWITLSPKPHSPPRLDILKICNELKVIIENKNDLLFAENIYQTANEIRKEKNLFMPLLFLQPAWNNLKSQKLTIEFIKSNPKWRLSLQTHKWLNVL